MFSRFSTCLSYLYHGGHLTECTQASVLGDTPKSRKCQFSLQLWEIWLHPGASQANYPVHFTDAAIPERVNHLRTST